MPFKVTSGSTKVVDFGTNRKRVYDFLLVINSGYECRRWNKKLSYCWETVRRESMPRIAEMDVEITT